jgi:hypothetical protein
MLIAQAQVQMGCSGTLLQARGRAELKRLIDALRVSLSLEAEAATADGALASLQARLDSVRQALQQLGVRKLEVTSPSTWTRPAERKQLAQTTASLQVSGELAPAQLQQLIRQAEASGQIPPGATDAQKTQSARAFIDRQLDQLETQFKQTEQTGKVTLSQRRYGGSLGAVVLIIAFTILCLGSVL